MSRDTYNQLKKFLEFMKQQKLWHDVDVQALIQKKEQELREAYRDYMKKS